MSTTHPGIDPPSARPLVVSAVSATRASGAAVVDHRICWTTVAGLGIVHAGSVVGLIWLVVRPSWPTVLLATTMYAACGLSMTAGYHRLFAHRTYRASAPVRWVLLLLAAATFQNSALSWSADHRAHHADTDGPRDPHAITRGAWYAHVSWLFRRRVASDDVSRLGDLWSVRSVRLQHRWYACIAIGVGLVLPMAVASAWGDALGGLVVAGFLRAGVMMQATFSINSLAHLVGKRRYDARSTARDFTPTALLTFGEGYHSFHHRFPFDYRSSPAWWHYDPNKWFIWGMARAHLVDAVRTASPSTIARALASARVASSPGSTATTSSPTRATWTTSR